MDYDKTKEFLEVMDNFRKTIHKISFHKIITPGEFMMLMSIHCEVEKNKENNKNVLGIRVSELSNRLHASKPAISRMIKNVEEKEYVERIIDKNDRRNVYVNLTSNGKSIIENAKKDADQELILILDQLGEEDTKELMRICNKLVDIIKNRQNNT